jgi:hypothetical protein
MAISTESKYLLNNAMGAVANKVGLGTLIENAESVTAGEIALAENKVLIGSASGVGAAQSFSGDVTVVASGVTAIGALKVTTAMLAADAVDGAKIADDAVSAEHLDDGILPSHVIKFAARFTTLGGAAAEAITLTGALATDLSFVRLVDDGTNNVTISSWAMTTNTLTVTFSGNPGADAVIEYQVVRAVA